MTFKFKTLLIALSSLSSCVCDEVQQTHGVDMTAVAMDLSDINLNFLQADSTTSAQVDTINISEKDPEGTSKDHIYSSVHQRDIFFSFKLCSKVGKALCFLAMCFIFMAVRNVFMEAYMSAWICQLCFHLIGSITVYDDINPCHVHALSWYI